MNIKIKSEYLNSVITINDLSIVDQKLSDLPAETLRTLYEMKFPFVFSDEVKEETITKPVKRAKK